ncbi:EamA family transporter [Danxiaibacter flavus]|uniref:EamA family transporter n=1 Tax=Danxiaibacter flavus TaxID=3049108 RepID=A0ABV3ZMY8_9BACT|nr:EamA family transporter [Chitinophagaceae bacterium DXS]
MSNSNPYKTKAYIALTTTSIIWGTTWVGSKAAVHFGMPGLEVSFVRQFIAGSIFLAYFLFSGESLPTLKQFGWLLLLAICNFVFANGLSTWSLKYVSSGLAALIGALYPLCVVIIELLFFNKRNYNLLTLAGLLVGIAGVLFVLYENAFHEQPVGYGFGILLGLIGMVSWSFGTILIARNKYQMNPYYAMGWQMFLASFMIFGLAKTVQVPLLGIHEIPLQAWLAIAYLIGVGSLITFIAFVYTVRYLPPALSSVYAYINPLVAMLAGYWVLGEPLSVNLFFGAIITLAGVYLVNFSLKK